jgi:ABC-type oligopeptide transport system substrate-binding subunit
VFRTHTAAWVAASLLFAAPAAAQSPAEKEVLASLQSFLDAMKAKDTVGMKLVLDSATRFTLLRSTPNGSRVMVLSGADFLKAVSQPDGPTYDEPIRKPVVQIDGDLAHVWAEYQVRLEPGKVHHCGYDSFQMARLGGRWRILNVSDTYREQGCGAPWP